MLEDIKGLGLDFLPGKDKDEFVLKINDIEIPVLSARVIRAFDTCADSWSANVLWNLEEQKESMFFGAPESNSLFDAMKPLSWYDSKVYLGGTLVNTGRVYSGSNSVTSKKTAKELGGFSYTIDIVDSNVWPPFEFKKMTLLKIVERVLEGYDIKVIAEPSALVEDKVFKKVSCHGSEKIFAFLTRLARQRNSIISNNVQGNVLITTADVNQKPVGTITDGKLPGYEHSIKWDGRKLFGYYKALAHSPGRRSKTKRKFKSEIAVDHTVPGDRRITVRADESDIAELQNPIEWYRSKQLVEALTLQFPVVGWYDPSGGLWRPNTLVTVESTYLEIPNGYTFFIRAVEYQYSNRGNISILHLVPKEAYTGKTPKNPWEGNSTQSNFIDKVLG